MCHDRGSGVAIRHGAARLACVALQILCHNMALQCETGVCRDRVGCMVVSSVSQHDILCLNSGTSGGGWSLSRQGLAVWCHDTVFGVATGPSVWAVLRQASSQCVATERQCVQQSAVCIRLGMASDRIWIEFFKIHIRSKVKIIYPHPYPYTTDKKHLNPYPIHRISDILHGYRIYPCDIETYFANL